MQVASPLHLVVLGLSDECPRRHVERTGPSKTTLLESPIRLPWTASNGTVAPQTSNLPKRHQRGAHAAQMVAWVSMWSAIASGVTD